jgi:hypothetical protein
MLSGNRAPIIIAIDVWRMVYDILPHMSAQRKWCPIIDGAWAVLHILWRFENEPKDLSFHMYSPLCCLDHLV